MAELDARPPLEAVLLDAGGVLVRLDFEWMAETLGELGVTVKAADLRRGEVFGRRCYDGSAGHAAPNPGDPPPPLGVAGDTRAYFGGMLEATGVPSSVIPVALERFLQRQAHPGLWSRPCEGAREMLDDLARLGLRRAVVSNSDGRAEQHLADSGVREGLEFVVDSHVVGVEKPDPRIFRIALDRLGLAAERAIFVGDIRRVDEAGARAAGLHFVLIDPYGDYAAPGTPSIATIGQLPAHLAERFRLVAASGGADPRTVAGRSAGGAP